MPEVAPTREQCEAWAREALRGNMSRDNGRLKFNNESLLYFAALAFAAGAASRPVTTTDSTGADVLTEDECEAIWARHARVFPMLQSAARIGEERERERAAKWLEEQAEKIAARQPYEGDDGSANKARAWEAKLYAVAIRRGEGG